MGKVFSSAIKTILLIYKTVHSLSFFILNYTNRLRSECVKQMSYITN